MTVDEVRLALAPVTISVPVAARVLDVTPNLAYRAVKAGEIESIRVGSSIRIPTAPLRRRLGLDAEVPAAAHAA